MVGPGNPQRGLDVVPRPGEVDILILVHPLEVGHVLVVGTVQQQVVDVRQFHAVVPRLVLPLRGGNGNEGADGVVVVKADGAVLRVAVIEVEEGGCGHRLPAPAVSGQGDAFRVHEARQLRFVV